MTSTSKKSANISLDKQNIRVSKLKIILNTNIPGKSEILFRFDMLYHPDLDKGRYSTTKYTLPYFTDVVKYPMEQLARKVYAERVDFFFNKTRFLNVLRKNPIQFVDYNRINEDADTKKSKAKALHENAEYNVKCMLILLFPIADEFENVFKTSYDQFILDKPSSEIFTFRNIDPVTFFNPTWVPLYNYFGERKYNAPKQEISYLKEQGITYVVTDVVWQNDLINHPVYRDFISVYNDKIQEKTNNKPKIMNEIANQELVFQRTLLKYLHYSKRVDDPKTDTNVFDIMAETLIENIMGVRGKSDRRSYGELYVLPMTQRKRKDGTYADITDVHFSKENVKRDTITKIVNYFGSIDDIFHNLSGDFDNDEPSKIRQLSKKELTEKLNETKNEEGKQLLEKISNKIMDAYIEYTNYNEGAEPGMKISLKDTTRILTELYSVVVKLKTLKLLKDFVFDVIPKLNLSEKNDDGSTKTKLEIDMINVLKTNYPYYVSLNNSINTRLKNVTEPLRRSSNNELQQFFKNLINPYKETNDMQHAQSNYNTDMLLDIYNKYISNTSRVLDKTYIDQFMNVGVSTIISSEKDTKEPGDDTVYTRELSEIYVYINVVKKNEYEKNAHRNCVMSDDIISNNVKQLLYSNQMLDRTYPETNSYRNYKFLNNSDTDNTGKNVTPTTTSQNTKGGNVKYSARSKERSPSEFKRHTLRYTSRNANTKTRRQKK
jgi:hypothetical protein